MNLVMAIIFFVFLVLASALFVSHLIQRYRQIGRMDVPNERSMHHADTPTGAGIVIASFLGLALIFFATILEINSRAIMIAISFIVAGLTLVGWLDDRNNLGIYPRLFVFFLLAVVLTFGIGVVDNVKLGAELIVLIPYWLALVLTILAFVWLVNLYNFMDGMDGLAAMQTIVAACGFSILFSQIGTELSEVLSITCGVLGAATIGFLFWNWHPAKIFMGDVGSLAIGGFFATLMVCSVRYFDMSLFSGVLILGVFIFDASYTLITRLVCGEKITQAHSSHLYQRLVKAGVAQNKIVIGYSLLMVAFALLGIIFEFDLISLGLAGVFALIGVISLLITVRELERR